MFFWVSKYKRREERKRGWEGEKKGEKGNDKGKY
jgi:hypothetical protein